MAVHVANESLLLHKEWLRLFGNHAGDHQTTWHGDQGDEGHNGVDAQHHNQNTRQRDRGANELVERLL